MMAVALVSCVCGFSSTAWHGTRVTQSVAERVTPTAVRMEDPEPADSTLILLQTLERLEQKVDKIGETQVALQWMLERLESTKVDKLGETQITHQWTMNRIESKIDFLGQAFMALNGDGGSGSEDTTESVAS
jgi:hypothetical protein